MTRTNERRGGLWGLGFLAFFTAAAAIFLAAGESGDTPGELASYYADNRELEGVGVLLGAAGFCLLPFLGALRAMLRDADGGNDGLATLAFGAGLVFTAMLFAAGATSSAIPTTANWVDDYRVDATLADTFDTYAWFFWMYAGVAGGILAGAASLVAWRTRVLPRWLAVIGLVAAIAGFASAPTWGASTLLTMAWLVLTSVVMVTRSRHAAKRSAPATVSS